MPLVCDVRQITNQLAAGDGLPSRYVARSAHLPSGQTVVLRNVAVLQVNPWLAALVGRHGRSMARGTTQPSQPLRAIGSARALRATAKLAPRWPPHAARWITVFGCLPIGCLVRNAWRLYMALAPTPAANAPRHSELHAAMGLAAKPGRIAKTQRPWHHEHPESSGRSLVPAAQRHLGQARPSSARPESPVLEILDWTKECHQFSFCAPQTRIIGMMVFDAIALKPK